MADSADAHLQLKKRARRRLVGAVALAGLAAVILPMVMDEEPKQQVQDVQIRIPGQDQPPFRPNVVAPKAVPTERPAGASPSVATVDASGERTEQSPAPKAGEAPPAKRAEPASKPSGSPPEKQEKKPVEKSVDKAAEKPTDKPAVKASEKPAAKTSDNDAERAAAILAGKATTIEPAASSEEFVILIGAFANQANVKQLQTKIGELGIKVFTEPLDSPNGKRTRVRAGPFPNRAAADKALSKIKRIGVNGVIAPKQ